MNDETDNLILARLDKVLRNQEIARQDRDEIKARLSAIEKHLIAIERRIIDQGEAAVAAWDTLDAHGKRLAQLEQGEQ
jgi:hypothetical protein